MILVTGGTGTLGSVLVDGLRAEGHQVRILSRRDGVAGGVRGDLATGEGLAEAVKGAEFLIHTASQAITNTRQVDIEGTRLLLQHAGAAGVANFVYVSIVGVDRVRGFPYYAAKREVERMVEASGVPWTVLRATQFHEFLPLRIFPITGASGLLLVGRDWPIQPVDVKDVSRRLAGVVAEPSGLLPEFGGPEVLSWEQVARAWRAAGFTRRPVVAVPLPGGFSRGWREGAMLARDPEPAGVTTFGDWLRTRSASRSSR